MHAIFVRCRSGCRVEQGEAELAERAFANDARTNSRTKGSDSQQHSDTLNPHATREPDLSA